MPPKKPNGKKDRPLDTLLKPVADVFDSVIRRLFGLTENWHKRRNVVANNYQLGLRHLKLNNNKDAIFRFKLVTWFEPKRPEAWYYLGCAYFADGRNAKACEALKQALKLRPGYEEAVYMYAMAAEGKVPENQLPRQTPLLITQTQFDALAPNYEQNQAELEYRGHIVLADAILAAVPPEQGGNLILDLGCGTGLLARRLRGIAAHITGVDISPKMLTLCEEVRDETGRRIYDALLNSDIAAFLREAPRDAYDAVAACNVLSYIGDCQAIFTLVSQVMRPGGVFAFTADRMDGSDYRFDKAAGRFRFSQSYLTAQASAAGLTQVTFQEAAIYPDYMSWIGVFAK